MRYRAFAAMQTGNTILLGRVLADDGLPDDTHGPSYYAMIAVCFFCGVVLHRLFEFTSRFENRGASAAAIPLASFMMAGEAVPWAQFRGPGPPKYPKSWTLSQNHGYMTHYFWVLWRSRHNFREFPKIRGPSIEV